MKNIRLSDFWSLENNPLRSIIIKIQLQQDFNFMEDFLMFEKGCCAELKYDFKPRCELDYINIEGKSILSTIQFEFRLGIKGIPEKEVNDENLLNIKEKSEKLSIKPISPEKTKHKEKEEESPNTNPKLKTVSPTKNIKQISLKPGLRKDPKEKKPSWISAN